jgi:hypothetical protein
VLFGLAQSSYVGLAAALIAGISWIAVLAPLNVSAQVALPGWVKGRGLAVFAIVQFGAMTIGSALWGQVGRLAGLPAAHIIAAVGALACIPLLMRWKLQTGADVDLTPSLHWPDPVLSGDVELDRGPVQIIIEYKIAPQDREAFLAAISELSHERLRDGAYDWDVFEDAAEPGRMIETFLVSSWIEHQRQHHRVTADDREVQERLHKFHKGTKPPFVQHLIAARPKQH